MCRKHFLTIAKLLTCSVGCRVIFHFFPQKTTGQSHQKTAHHTVTLGLWSDRWWSSLRLVSSQQLQVRLFTAADQGTCALSEKITFSWQVSIGCIISFTQFLYQLNIDAGRFLNRISLTFSGQVRTCILPLKSMSSFCRTLYNDSVLSRANFFLVLLVF